MDEPAHRPATAALSGFLFLLPFAALNAVVANRVEPVFSLIRPGLHTSPREYVLLAAVLLLLPAGAIWALRPTLRRDAHGRRHFYLMNAMSAGLLLLVFTVLAVALGDEIYRCDVLGNPNCD
jgi:hypothetical protein